MEKRNIQPQQQKPVVRPTVAKPAIAGLSEEQLTAGWTGASGAIASSIPCYYMPYVPGPMGICSTSR